MTETEMSEWRAKSEAHDREQTARRKANFLAQHGVSESDAIKESLASMAVQAEQALNAQDDGYEYRVTVKK